MNQFDERQERKERDAAGEEGLRAAVREVLRAHAVAGITTIEYSLAENPEAAREAVAEDVRTLKPLYNEGLGRYRTTDPPMVDPFGMKLVISLSKALIQHSTNPVSHV